MEKEEMVETRGLTEEQAKAEAVESAETSKTQEAGKKENKERKEKTGKQAEKQADADKPEPQANRFGQRKRRFERRQPGVGVGVGGVCHVDDVLLVQLVCRPMFADDAICGYTRMVSINGVRVASGPCARSHSVEDVTSSTVG